MPAMLILSYWFYAAWNFKLLGLILFTTAVSYFCALAMEKTEKKSLKKFYITLTLLVCLGTLFFFKYYNFMADTVSGIAGAVSGKTYDFSLNLILPVGISFYTFQTLSYAIDVYRGDIKAERNFFWYALFVSFFPQLVAGPIERPENLMPQLKEFHRLDAENAFIGMQKMAVGFFKKIAVADILATYVNAVYNDIIFFANGVVLPILSRINHCFVSGSCTAQTPLLKCGSVDAFHSLFPTCLPVSTL